jgi:predicted nucleic acid-binding protein
VPVIVDASLLVAVSTRDARSDRVGAWFLHWLDTSTELHAPELALYEVASGITRLAGAGLLPIHRIAEIWEHLGDLPLIFHPFARGPRVVELALSLGRTSAYDAAYLALAEDLRAEVWTLDGRFARNASARGFPVHLMDEDSRPASEPPR